MGALSQHSRDVCRHAAVTVSLKKEQLKAQLYFWPSQSYTVFDKLYYQQY